MKQQTIRRVGSNARIMSAAARLSYRCRVPSLILFAMVAQWPRGIGAIDLVVDASMVQNIQTANETAERYSSTDYVDLTCKVNYDSGQRAYPWILRLRDAACGVRSFVAPEYD